MFVTLRLVQLKFPVYINSKAESHVPRKRSKRFFLAKGTYILTFSQPICSVISCSLEYVVVDK
jgi:hypothetical protein